ncbi:23508_t:CDS:2 [Dentiscutata erythropus]|uniref:Cytidine deaminase n=1 Tax=Dentiscutata erythropus TaxID=1348616 RepID=A0A9N9FZN6_9GLOM|nr:23508_t:CDS:2 [Dentiscutata erythropus]
MRELTSEEIKKLVELTLKAKEFAYCPYSNFRVGSTVFGENGIYYTGANVENASYSGAICAERVAITKAVSEGQKKFIAIGVCTDVSGEFTKPCGICRQFMTEFATDLPIYLIQPDGSYIVDNLKNLFPDPFKVKILKLEQH